MTYINNVHPKKHADIYIVVEHAIDAAIPLWNLTLAPQTQPEDDEDPNDPDDTFLDDREQPYPRFDRRIRYECEYKRNPEYYTPEEAEEEYDQDEDVEDAWRQEFGTELDEDDERFEEWLEARRIVVLPDAEEDFEPFEPLKPLDMRKKYGRHPVQVVLEMFNVELTPEKSEYPGGEWHVDGRWVSILNPILSFVIHPP